jgi:hypothetical protein
VNAVSEIMNTTEAAKALLDYGYLPDDVAMIMGEAMVTGDYVNAYVRVHADATRTAFTIETF